MHNLSLHGRLRLHHHHPDTIPESRTPSFYPEEICKNYYFEIQFFFIFRIASKLCLGKNGVDRFNEASKDAVKYLDAVELRTFGEK